MKDVGPVWPLASESCRTDRVRQAVSNRCSAMSSLPLPLPLSVSNASKGDGRNNGMFFFIEEQASETVSEPKAVAKRKQPKRRAKPKEETQEIVAIPAEACSLHLFLGF